MPKDTYVASKGREICASHHHFLARIVFLLVVSIGALASQPALAMDWTGFYAGFNMGLGRGMESSLQTTATAEEHKTVEWCQNTNSPNGNQIPGLNTEARCDSSSAAVWTPGVCAVGQAQGPNCVVTTNKECPVGSTPTGNVCYNASSTGIPPNGQNNCTGGRVGPFQNLCYETVAKVCPVGSTASGQSCVSSTPRPADVCTIGGVPTDAQNEQQCTQGNGAPKDWIVEPFHEDETDRDLVTSGPQTMMSMGVVAGGQVQSGNLVFGAEADLDFVAGGMSRLSAQSYAMVDVDPEAQEYIEDHSLQEVGPQNLRTNFGIDDDEEGSPTWLAVSANGRVGINGLATIRARIGAAFDENWLAFVTVGPAWGHVTTESTVSYTTSDAPETPVTRTFGEERWVVGYTMGAGVNVQIAEHTRLSLEYRYTNLGRITASDTFEETALDTGIVSGGATTSIDGTMHAIRAGILFNF